MEGKEVMMHSREIIRLLEADGWYQAGMEGAHCHFKHPTKPGKITMAHHCNDNPTKQILSIEKLSGVKLIQRA